MLGWMGLLLMQPAEIFAGLLTAVMISSTGWEGIVREMWATATALRGHPVHGPEYQEHVQAGPR